MSVKKYKFVSPGIFIKEVDQSFRAGATPAVGPVVVGRTRMGPAMRPVRIDSFGDFVSTFGNPVSGYKGGDLWRDGNLGGPTYAAYAAQAYLSAKVGPVTMMRLLGTQHDNKESTGKAGWTTTNGTNESMASNGGAYGLFVVDKADLHTPTVAGDAVRGRLAAVWYLNSGAIVLKGEDRAGVAVTGSCGLIKSDGSSVQLRAIIKNSDGSTAEETSFNFDRSSDIYIRKVFNCNPQLAGEATEASVRKTYWLGQSYDQFVTTHITGSTAAGDQYGFVAPLRSDLGAGTSGYHNQQMAYTNGKTGWFVSQDTQAAPADASIPIVPQRTQNLFRLVGLEGGVSVQNRFKISIEDIKFSRNTRIDPYGSFSIVLRDIQDTDNNVRVIERFTNCNLNPNSTNYLAKKIGDAYMSWTDADSRYREYGDFPTRSRYFRVEMNEQVNNGSTNPTFLPFGLIGPPRPKTWALVSAGDNAVSPRATGVLIPAGAAEAKAYAGMGSASPQALSTLIRTDGVIAAEISYPALMLRSSSLDGGLSDQTNAYFGVSTNRDSSTAIYDESVTDFLLPIDEGYAAAYDSDSSSTTPSFLFTLDDIAFDGAKKCWNYVSGSRQAATNESYTAMNGAEALLDEGIDRFTAVFHGGSDGLDITEMEPFGNHNLVSTDEFQSYEYNTIKRAITAVSDPEFVEMNLLSIPGLYTTGLTDYMTEVCEERGDAMAIIDLESDYVPRTESTDSVETRRGNVATAVSSMKARSKDTSYAACYYPWVQIRDSIDGDTLWAPPSIVALGAMANSELSSGAVWFAPAGFNRGGLTDGAAGIPVIGVRQRLSKKDRDNLYEQNINPIAKFPSEGIVIFGQKTLQARPSALDRVNVRRLMIYLKKQISRASAGVLFDQNTQATWNRFIALVEPILSDAKTRFGLTDYRLILDETTTTPDLVDQNVLYAKIMLKPARAIEYIAIDFNIMPTGASFDD